MGKSGETKEERKRRRKTENEEKKAEKKERKKKDKKRRRSVEGGVTGGDGDANVEQSRKKRRAVAPLEKEDGPPAATAAEALLPVKAMNGEKHAGKEKAPAAAAAPRKESSSASAAVAASAAAAGRSDDSGPSPFRRVKVRAVVSLSPSSLLDVQGNVRRLSCEDVTRYASVSSATAGRGGVVNELPYVHFDVEVSAVIFNPSIGTRLTGEVNESFPSHVGVLVNGFINASVSADQMREAGYVFDGESNEWRNGNAAYSEDAAVKKEPAAPEEMVGASDRITFTLQKVHECDGIVSMEGSDPSFTLGRDTR
eukprot:CAMPEP_0113599160 /NCGR_PEP_ID=MMETSP0015_2-20120614/41986_1 /TAXON_ID=2838 /ORGANISM="Odontella" /LENGTH=310 /DNA_ID=CAMNT_0000507253 /DNA_START=154 /DNA_END=1085 /DNA_ORIENTATION=- /assembly_acc=CAM_ASM_000160